MKSDLMKAWLGVLAIVIVCPLVARGEAKYRLTDLADFLPMDINNHGQIVGNVPLPSTSYSYYAALLQPNAYHAEPLDIGFQVDEFRNLYINNLGQIADGASYSLRVWTPANPNGALGTVTHLPLGELAGSELPMTVAMSQGGTLLIFSWAFSAGGGVQSFVWKPVTPNGAVGDLFAFGGGGGANVFLNAIDSEGNFLGSDPDGPFLFKPSDAGGIQGVRHSLNIQAGDGTELLFRREVVAINDEGQVAGNAVFGERTHAIYWSPDDINGTSGATLDLGLLPGRMQSYAVDINNSGVVVGNADDNTNTSHGIDKVMDGLSFIWTRDGGMQSLTDLLDFSGKDWQLYAVTGINDRGQIVGLGMYDPDGPGELAASRRGFVLNPIPEPTACGLMVAALLCSLPERCRRLRRRYEM